MIKLLPLLSVVIKIEYIDYYVTLIITALKL